MGPDGAARIVTGEQMPLGLVEVGTDSSRPGQIGVIASLGAPAPAAAGARDGREKGTHISTSGSAGSEQAEGAEAGHAVATDHQVVVDGHAQGTAGLHHLPGHLDVGRRRGGVA